MSSLSYSTLESLWTSAGGSKSLAPVMAAIAIAESGGNPNSLNNNPRTGDYSVGLWQINYFGSLYGPRSKSFGSPAALQASPTAQARAAVSVYNSQGLSAWSTYTSGAYRQYLGGSHYNGTGTATDTSTNGTGQDASSSSKPPDCLLGFSGPAGVGYVCLLTKGQGRALLGGILVGTGGIIALGGVAILAAYGLKRTGALDTAAHAAAVVPGAGGVAARLASASAAVNASPQTVGERRAGAEHREHQARAEQRAENREARAAAGARRRAAKDGADG